MSRPMSSKEQSKYWDRVGELKAEGLIFKIRIIDTRTHNGEGLELLIEPIMGSGQVWKTAALVALDGPENKGKEE